MTQASLSTTPETTYHPVIWDYSADRVPVINLSRTAIISAIAAGEWDSIFSVIGSNPSTGECWNASREIARASLEEAVDRYGNDGVPRNCLAFAEDQLGLMGCRALTLAAA